MNCPGKCNNFRGSVLNPWSGGIPCGRGRERVSEAVYLTATKIWYHVKRFSGTKCHDMNVWFRLKRFLGTVCEITAPQARGLP